DAATHGLADFSLESVLQATGKETISISTQPIIVSFVDEAGNYTHFYTIGATSHKITLNSRLANFAIVNNTVYLLTTDGKLYNAGTYPITGPVDLGSASAMISSNKVYDTNAFMYAVTGGGNTHIITKSVSKNDPLYVLSFADGAATATGESIRYGYGEYLDSAEIVSTLYLGSNSGIDTLLIATNENGLFKIGIKVDTANQDSSNNGRSSQSEEYQDFTLYSTL
ncbi:MAG: hypothetical protein PHS76_02815, partial [Sphaerochaeta sp.]|nr:hypothetical protein [Sphaerochaeta sp.]